MSADRRREPITSTPLVPVEYNDAAMEAWGDGVWRKMSRKIPAPSVLDDRRGMISRHRLAAAISNA